MYRPPAKRVQRSASSKSTSTAAHSAAQRPVRAHSSPTSAGAQAASAESTRAAASSQPKCSASAVTAVATARLSATSAGAATAAAVWCAAPPDAVTKSTTSSTLCASLAPDSSSLAVPADPVSAHSRRPWRSACRAVISDPDRSCASTTTTTSAIAAISSLRMRKWSGSGGAPGANIDNSSPFSAISKSRVACCLG